jgi:hypothetical protein
MKFTFPAFFNNGICFNDKFSGSILSYAKCSDIINGNSSNDKCSDSNFSNSTCSFSLSSMAYVLMTNALGAFSLMAFPYVTLALKPSALQEMNITANLYKTCVCVCLCLCVCVCVCLCVCLCV